MSPLVCLYFQVHQPYRLRDLRVTEIGQDPIYFDDEKNHAIFRKVAEKCYLPANAVMLEILKAHPEFTVSYSLSGVFLEQCEEYGPDVLASFQALAETGRVEFLAETYYHSLSLLTSLPEFALQVKLHTEKIERLFGQCPRIFRNTELIYRNELAEIARLLGFHGILAEGADFILQGRTPNVPYAPPVFRLSEMTSEVLQREPLRSFPQESKDIRILLKNYQLSDDIAFRFSNRSWAGYPLNANTFATWVCASGGHNVNLFMDYETFGEHQWEDTGIFAFLRELPRAFAREGLRTATPSEVLRAWGARETDVFDAHSYISWADIERDLSAWQGNGIQNAALAALYALEARIKETGNEELLDLWRKLQTSDHFYYMCTKYWSDGDVHKYFSPYESPYEAYRRFSHALCDLNVRLEKELRMKKTRMNVVIHNS